MVRMMVSVERNGICDVARAPVQSLLKEKKMMESKKGRKLKKNCLSLFLNLAVTLEHTNVVVIWKTFVLIIIFDLLVIVPLSVCLCSGRISFEYTHYVFEFTMILSSNDKLSCHINVSA